MLLCYSSCSKKPPASRVRAFSPEMRELLQTALVEGEPGRKRAQSYCAEIKVRYQEWQSAVADPRYPLVLTQQASALVPILMSSATFREKGSLHLSCQFGKGV